jgi:predicted CXXCH cytochrome family protein
MGNRTVTAAAALALALAFPAAGAPGENCGASGCHAGEKYATAHRAATAADRGRCTACHDAHAPGEKGTLRIAERDLCGKCHKGYVAAHQSYPIEDQRCGRCHAAHAPNSKKRMGVSMHEVVRECDHCHLDAKGPTPFKLKKPDPALCFDCHGDVEKAAKGKGGHPAVTDGTCTSCHSPHGAWQPRLLLKPQGKLCAECHEGVAKKANATPFGHEPVIDGNCTGCHDPHGSGNAKLFKGDGLATCGACHREVRGWLAQRSSHDAVRAGKCLTCHEPHQGKAHLVREGGTGLCLGCHAELQKRLQAAGAVIHPPATKDCLACHRPHSSIEPWLLRKQAAQICLGCHDVGKPELVKAHGGYAVQASDCSGCHDPHAGKKGLLRPELHMPFADKGCTTCHYPPATPPVYPVQKPGGLKNCAECHDFASDLAKLGKAHDPVKNGSCFKCHVPHAATRKHLLNDAPWALCTKCHDPNVGKAGKAHLDARAGRDCTSCHVPHEPSKMREAPKPPPPPPPPPAKKGAPPAKAPAKKTK